MILFCFYLSQKASDLVSTPHTTPLILGVKTRILKNRCFLAEMEAKIFSYTIFILQIVWHQNEDFKYFSRCMLKLLLLK